MASSTDPEKYVGDDVATNKAADLANTIATAKHVLELNQGESRHFFQGLASMHHLNPIG